MQSPPNAPLGSPSSASSPGLSWGLELIPVAAGGALGASLRALTYRSLEWPLDRSLGASTSFRATSADIALKPHWVSSR